MESSLYSPLTLLLLIQGAGSLFLALCLGTLYGYRRRPALLCWALAWLCNSLWLIPGTLGYRLDGGRTDWLRDPAVLCGWWHAAFWVIGLGHFRRQIGHDERLALGLRHALVLLAVVGVVALLVSRNLGFRERNVLIGCVLALVYLWGTVLASRHWQQVRRTPALLLGIALGLYALDRLHFAGFFLLTPPPADLSHPYAGGMALVDCVIQTLVAAAMILYLIDAEQTDLRELVRRLEDSEERFRLIFEHSGVGMSLLNREGRLLHVNPALVRMLGYTPEELQGRSLSEFVHSQDATNDARRDAGVPNGETPSFYEREKRYVRKDGESIWARVMRVPVRDSDGKTRHYVGVLIDITLRRKAEEQLAASEERYRLLNQVARDGIHVTDDRGAFVEVNPAFCQMLAQDRESLLRLTLPDVAADPEALRAHLQTLLQDGGQRLETRLKRRDGSLVEVEMSGSLLELEGRKLLHGICRDVSERKRAEEALRVARERVREERDFSRQVLESADVLIFVVDPAGRIVHLNGACTNVLGYSESQVQGRFFWEVLLPERNAAVVREAHLQLVASNKVLKQGEETTWPLTNYEMHWRTQVGEERLVSWRNAVIRDAQGLVRFVISTGQDVTDQRQLEEQLRQARKMESLGTLVGGIAHDFNNQLTVVLGNLGLALGDLRALERVGNPSARLLHEPLDQAEMAAQRCAEITQRLQTFSSGKVGPTSREDPQRLLADMARQLQRDLPSTIQVRLERGPQGERGGGGGVWPVVVDASQLQQVLLNLASNARDAMPHGGTLTLAAANRLLQERDCALNVEARPGRFVEVTVTDTGTGMTPEVLGHIFEPFFTTKEPGRAAGMGLALVYGIVKAHGGWITVQSEPNRGSTFRLYLPVGDGAQVLGEARPDRPEGRSGGLILIVDDEDMVRGLADVVLRRGGYEVLQAGGGDEALAIFRERFHEIDLILLDYSMPGMTGLQVMREMQKIDPGVCVVFSSGYTRDSDTDQLLATGARAFVPKPYRPDDLVQTVRRVLEKQRGDRSV